MRSLQLESALTDYVGDAAEALRGELAAGAEVPFELEQHGRRRATGPALYCYRPLTRAFIADRWTAMQALPSYGEAATLLSSFDGLERYLSTTGVEARRADPRAQAGDALAALLGEVFEEQSDFELNPERLQTALGRLERSATSSTSDVTLVATLHGVTITSAELVLTSGLTIAQPDALEGLPLGATESSADAGHLVVVLAGEEGEPQHGLSRGRSVLKELLRALRLFGDGRVTLGPMAWVRIGGSAWGPEALGEGGRPHGMLVITSEQEDELRAFCNLVSRRAPHGNELAWALHRFELACGRTNPYDALSDVLMALRVLLEPEGPASAMLPGRLAALCATPQQRLALTERAVQALALERAVIAGTASPSAGSEALAADMADHLRALLRDVICGHLGEDLAGLADELLSAEAKEAEMRQAEAEAKEAEMRQAEAEAKAAEMRQAEAEAEATERKQAAADMVDGPVQSEAPASGQQALGYSNEAEEILDLFI